MCLESNRIVLVRDNHWLLDYWQVLLVNVDQADRVDISAVVRERELELLVLGLDVLRVDCQGAEDRKVDDVGVRA